ncbi:MAG: 50S ribosomal protein L23 [Flavobacteriaceae bacterium]|nr:50S ribosomal protein L23 [Flavobacteriaceae bacterium]
MEILLAPIVTEKASDASEMRKCYSFFVHPKANKIQIKKAVEKYYDVKVDKVRTLIYGAKHFTKFTKSGIQKGKTNYTKKAMVQLREGDEIDLYANV